MKYNRVLLEEVSDITKLAGFEFTKYIEYVEDGEIIALRALNLRNGFLDLTDVKKIYRTVSEKLPRSQLHKNDVLLTYTGNGYGDSAMINEDDKYHLAPNICKIAPKETIYPPFLFQYVKSKLFKEQMRNHMVGSSQPTIPMKTLRKLEVPFPVYNNQILIGDILKSLDDKIELNNRINQKLEEMAQAIFKSWFVDFEPWGGEMPFGWHEGVLSEIVSSIYSGGTPSTSTATYWGGGIPWLSSGETRNHFIIATDRSITRSGVDNSSTRLAHRFDVVMASAGQGFTRGQTSMLLFDSYVNQSVIVMSAQSPLYLFLNLSRRYEELRAISDSSSIRGSINTKMLAQFPILVPPNAALDEFSLIVLPLITQIENNLHESACLTILRDSLLPKLMSGEIRVLCDTE